MTGRRQTERHRTSGVLLSMLKRFLSCTAFALPFVSATTRAQTVQVVDQGSFTITVNGQRAGREDFKITSSPLGQGRDFTATATVSYGERRIVPELHADTGGTPRFYTVEVRNSGTEQERWKGNIVRGRVSAHIETPRGESAKEFIVTEGALILDDDVFHQYFFVAHRMTSGTVAALIPRRNTQVTLRVASAGGERVTIDGQDIEANHLVLTEGSGDQRDVWVDRQGRVLKVAIAARGIVALRDDPPK
jgi:hypothetical protein